ncbi:MAG: mobilization protein [Pseudomonadota bacterium]|nr:mobilization protein [Pseudomonadota bacterium]MDQ2764301.1 mobilization protein [Pseudomonadota bacterium]
MSQTLSKLEASIEAQHKKLAQLKARKLRIEQREKSKLQGAARKQDTRRKVLAGAMLLELMAKDTEFQKQMLGKLSAFLARPDDRGLFGLRSTAKEQSAS